MTNKKSLNMNDDGPIYNSYLDMLSKRLEELRAENKMSQAELAKKAKTSRDKINFAEMRMPGRRLQIEEIAEISKVFNVTIEYLIGMAEHKTFSKGNGLTDSANEIVSRWANSSLDEVDVLIHQFNDTNLIDELQNYLMVSYVIENLLTKTIADIKEKTLKQQDLNNLHIQKIGAVIQYLTRCSCPQENDDSYLRNLTAESIQQLTNAWHEIGQFTHYNNDKGIAIGIKYSNISKAKEILEDYREYLEYRLYKGIMKSITNAKDTIIKDDKYFYNIKKYFNETK